MNDTIAAISTALSAGAISIIRLSGKDAIKIANKISTIDLTKKKSHTISYGYIKEDKEIIDEVLISIMKSPKTFTTEDIVEINCHGGITTTNKILKLLLDHGARLAEPGEFTKRAFLNGRIDLTEAESVMTLINTKSDSARKIAINNLKGTTSNSIKKLRQQILDIISNIEVNIDYPEYKDIEIMTIEKINNLIDPICEKLDEIIKNSKNSKVITDGIDVSIIGSPNVGKSSILNLLLNENKAIVTSVAGTTRDIVEGQINLDGITLNIIDTAGIRQTEDIVEKLGVDKSYECIEKADLVILVLNNNRKINNDELFLLKKIENKKSIIVINKNDLESKIDKEKIINKSIVYTNTITEKGIEALKHKITSLFNLNEIEKKDYNYVSNIESISKLDLAKKSLLSVKNAISETLPIDLIEIDLKEAWNLLGEVIGETYNEEMLNNLFKNFCVGK